MLALDLLDDIVQQRGANVQGGPLGDALQAADNVTRRQAPMPNSPQ